MDFRPRNLENENVFRPSGTGSVFGSIKNLPRNLPTAKYTVHVRSIH